ncbi:astacin, partial [Ostertagia ostertagi]
METSSTTSRPTAPAWTVPRRTVRPATNPPSTHRRCRFRTHAAPPFSSGRTVIDITHQPTPIPRPLFDRPNFAELVNSLNAHTTAFSKPGQGYENVAGAMYEIDMTLTVPQASQITAHGRRKRKIIADVKARWQSTTIPYRFAISDAAWQSRIRAVMAKFSKNTCLRFVENSGSDYILFNRGEGCYSPVGRLGGAQEVSIGYGCETDGIISHEIGHSLGFYHEQTRSDRDNYVTVYPKNAVPGTEGQFDKLSPSQIVDYGVPYDYGSVMHYSSIAFSSNSVAKTVVPLQPQYEHTIGSRVEPSFLDYKELNLAYCS